jgi:transcriptional regulator with PAS, ATPase and Fis domain
VTKKTDDGRRAALRTDRITDAKGSVLIDRVVVVVERGPSAGKRLSSAREKVIVGTHESCDLRLDDPAVSRFHCELTPVDGRLQIRDLGSRNGTFVDGVSVLHAFVAPASRIRLGRSELALETARDKLALALSERDRFGTLVGSSTMMRLAFAALERAAATDSTVLIHGETGTGKESAAESIHREGRRAKGPFITVDCGAIPAALLESELFGHERGAFTGALTSREGAFQVADGGTIFLDEIGELSAELQPKLLRVLESKQVKPVGANRYTSVDVRVIAATNRDLRAEVNKGTFRTDLYYRLAVLEVPLPSLRQRVEDLPALVDHILRGLGAADAPTAAALRAPEFCASIAHHAWPGNVRELRNYVERCLAFESAALPLPSRAPATSANARVDPTRSLREAREAWVTPFEREYVEALLARHKHNISAAARSAGVDRLTFYRLLRRHGLD